MNNAALVIAATEAKARLEGKTFATLEDRCKEAMRGTVDHWMTTDEDERFRAAFAAVMMTCSPEEKVRIEEELQALRMIGAMTQGIPVDSTQMKTPENPVALNKLWLDVKSEARTS